MTDVTATQPWSARLAASRERVLAAAREGRVDRAVLRSLADQEARYALTLCPMPNDPAAHVVAAHAAARPYLERLRAHDPSVAVTGGTAGYTYTPRKVLRRVLDHAVDHLNQLEQWQRWQHEGLVPTPTDGWAGSPITLEEDRAALSADELAAWLWRIDVMVDAVATRAGRLRPDEIDWQPAADGWSLRQMLHHLAATETFYVVWLDAAMPEETPARYAEANRRLQMRLRDLAEGAMEPGTTLFDEDAQSVTPTQIARRVLTNEQSLLAPD